MNDFLRGVRSGLLCGLAGVGLVAASFFTIESLAPQKASAQQTGNAWMILRVAWGAGAMGDVREYSSMEACEEAADHILRERTPNSESTTGTPGAWKFSFNRSGLRRHEPNISMLCVPGEGEIDAVRDGLEDKGWYRAL